GEVLDGDGGGVAVGVEDEDELVEAVPRRPFGQVPRALRGGGGVGGAARGQGEEAEHDQRTPGKTTGPHGRRGRYTPGDNGGPWSTPRHHPSSPSWPTRPST